MNVQGKVWGQTSLIFSGNNVEIHRIVGKKGGFCSKHFHKHKSNLFFVEKGKLLVQAWMDYGLVDTTILEAGSSHTIPPDIYHQFEVLEEGTIAYEIYWVELDKDDIERENVGGKG